MNADGSGVIQLTNSGALDTAPTWKSDGSRIAYHSDRDGNGEIYWMAADGSFQTRLTSHASADSAPDWE
jgi:Tol biopolymer transport system component